MKSIFSRGTLNIFDYTLIFGIIGVSVVYSFFTKEIDIIGSIAAFAGIACAVLVAKRSMSNFLFAVVNIILYSYIAFNSQLYGDAILNLFYFLPMQFVGWHMWRRNSETKNESKVQSRLMSAKQRWIVAGVCVVAIGLVGWILHLLGDSQPIKDATKVVVSIVAQYLMIKAFTEHWVLWIVAHTISIVIWTIATIEGNSSAGLMTIMWCFYLANSINGLVQWNKNAIK